MYRRERFVSRTTEGPFKICHKLELLISNQHVNNQILLFFQGDGDIEGEGDSTSQTFWCECCHENIPASDAFDHIKTYDYYCKYFLKDANKSRLWSCKVCPTYYLMKWAMIKHFFSDHPVPIEKILKVIENRLTQKRKASSQL